jgi:hypothetical protein
VPHVRRPFSRRGIRREAVGEVAALLGTALLLLLMMSQPDWGEPVLPIVCGAAGLALLVAGSYLMLSRRRRADRK